MCRITLVIIYKNQLFFVTFICILFHEISFSESLSNQNVFTFPNPGKEHPKMAQQGFIKKSSRTGDVNQEIHCLHL